MYNQHHQYPSFNTKNLHSGASDVGLELGDAAADNTGILSGQSGASHWQFQQRELSRRPQQDTLPLLSGYNPPQAPLAHMFSSSSLTLPQPTLFNADRHTHHRSETGPHDSTYLDVPSGEGQQTRSDFGITLLPINLPNDHSPRSSTSSSLLPRNDQIATPRTLPDTGKYLRHQLGWAQDTPINLASLPDQPSGQKPSYSLPTLAKLAIYGSRGKRETLEGIYKAIEDRFEWYKNDKSNAWKRSIRHTLSLHKMFKNIPRPLSKSGRGSYWELDITQGEGYKRDRKRGKKGAPAPEVIEAETARQLGKTTEEIILSSVHPKSPGQQDRNIRLQRRARRATTSLSRVSPYLVGEHSRAPSLTWAPPRSANAGQAETVTRVGYDGAWHVQQPSSTHHSTNPYQYSAAPFVTGGDFSGPVFPSPFVAGSSMQVLPPLVVPGGRYHAFDERAMYEGQLRQGRRDDGQDRDR